MRKNYDFDKWLYKSEQANQNLDGFIYLFITMKRRVN